MKIKKTLSMFLSLSLAVFPFNTAPVLNVFSVEKNWQSAYAELLEAYTNSPNFSDMEVNGSMYDLFDVNGDYIPELFISDGEYHTAYCHVYSFIDSECVKLFDDDYAYGTLLAVPEKSLIIHYVSHGGYSGLAINKFNGKESSCIDTFNDNIMNKDYETVFYKRNGVEVTANEYIPAYNSYVRNNMYEVGREFSFSDISAEALTYNYKNSSRYDTYNITPLSEEGITTTTTIPTTIAPPVIDPPPVTDPPPVVTEPPQTAPPVVTTVPAVNTENIYKDILDTFYENISTEWQNYTDSSVLFYGIDGKNTQNISYMWYQYNKNTPLSKTCYKIIDINKDGTDELIVGTVNEYDESMKVLDIYTAYNGKAVHIASSGERASLYITDSMVKISGSSGASSSSVTYYTIKDILLTAVEEYKFDNSENPENPYFYSDTVTSSTLNSDGRFYYTFGNYVNITSSEYISQMSNEPLLDFTLFSNYSSYSLNLGDINGDGIIDASDASAILAEYAAASTGSDSLLNEAQKKAADINNDGLIDAGDASNVLAYYSYTSTGGTESFETFKELEETTKTETIQPYTEPPVIVPDPPQTDPPRQNYVNGEYDANGEWVWYSGSNYSW